AGNQIDTAIQFNYQGTTVGAWQAVGPGPINVTAENNITYTSVSGRVTAVASDPSDASGNTYYVGSANGGVWKTTDGGLDWTPLTDNVVNQLAQPINTPIAALAVVPTNPNIVFAATGPGDTFPDSRGSVGILKSTLAGQAGSWSVVGNSGTNCPPGRR